MLVFSLPGMVIDGGMGVVISIVGGVCAAEDTPDQPTNYAMVAESTAFSRNLLRMTCVSWRNRVLPPTQRRRHDCIEN
jgi:hypothetical protein